MKKMDLLGEQPGNSELYYIKNKDKVLGTFVWESDGSAVLVDDYGLPSFMRKDVTAWLESRTPTLHRAHIEELLSQCGLDSARSVIDFAKGLSLTDTLWVTNDSSLLWDSVSLFQNRFDETIARIAFDGGMYGLPFSTTSPEFGTDGMLAKCWVRESDGQVNLYKAGTQRFSNAGKEPYSEVMAHQLLSMLGYKHVPYRLARFHGKLVSVCPLFTSEDIMLLPIYKWYKFDGIRDLVAECEKQGIAEGLAQHLVYDYLSWNTDRHAGNFGVLLDADTFELKGMAPIYDNGCSMLAYWNGTDDLTKYVTNSTPALYRSFEDGAKIGKRILGKAHNVQRLIGFKFDREALHGFSEERLCAIEQWLQGRVRWFLSQP